MSRRCPWVAGLIACACTGRGWEGDGEGGDDPAGEGVDAASNGPRASCDDGEANGSETDADCGGQCDPCGDGAACESGGDCLSLSCREDVCRAPACDDAVRNGAETDVDCGGSCVVCAVCRECGAGTDCETRLCEAGLCGPTIDIVSAVYAANCGAPTEVVSIAAACDFQQSCDYLFNYVDDVGFDPAFGCMKDLRVSYSCSGSDMVREFYEACAPCDPSNTPTQITLDLFCAPCLGLGQAPE